MKNTNNIAPEEIAKFDMLWHELATAHYEGLQSKNTEEDKVTEPWKHSNKAVREAWKLITAPANLYLLNNRLIMDMNPIAQMVTEEAKRQCEKRSNKTSP